MGKAAEPRGIQSLEIGLSVLRTLQDAGGPVILKELSTKTGLSPSKLHRYCASLARAGFAHQEARGVYCAVDLKPSEAAVNRGNRLRLIIMKLPELVQRTGCSVFISEWTNAGPIIMHIEESLQPISVRPRREGPLPAVTSATGQVFLAFLERNVSEKFYLEDSKRKSQGADDALATMKELQRRLASVRRNGLATSKGEHIKGISSIAVPVTVKGSVEFVVTCYGITETFDTSKSSSTATALLSFAELVND